MTNRERALEDSNDAAHRQEVRDHGLRVADRQPSYASPSDYLAARVAEVEIKLSETKLLNDANATLATSRLTEINELRKTIVELRGALDLVRWYYEEHDMEKSITSNPKWPVGETGKPFSCAWIIKEALNKAKP